MRFSEQWLREWIDPGVDTAALSEQLTLLGLEVDAVEPAAPPFSGVVIARIESVEPHPEADRLRVCQVSTGTHDMHTVVCGADNSAAGLVAPYARVGAELPGERRIERTEVRGVTSAGMLCSAQELGLDSEASDGLLALPETAPLGRDYRAWAGLDDRVIELELTPNRGDCLSLRGIAREVAVACGGQIGGPETAPVTATTDARFPVWLEAPAACPRYVGRVIRGVDASAETPTWLAERLRRGGIRPLNPVVDVTNYVMLELGQPMHAFDLDRLQEGIRVRYAERGERIELLDGRETEIDAETLVIADAAGPVALAGIMGGARTAVDTSTRDIFLESACFQPAVMAGRARRYGAHTDSSHRFERGVDPAITAVAMERASALLQSICGGEPGPVHDVQDDAHLPKRGTIRLRRTRLERLLGHHPGDERVTAILSGLGMEVSADAAGWSALPPSWRYDLAIEADLVEEIARVHGYNRSPRTHAPHAATMAATPERQRSTDMLRDALVERDYHEAITYSFVDSRLQRLLDPEAQPLPLSNPISADMDVMRTSLWPGLIGALRRNLNRQQPRVRLFESGLRFRPDQNGQIAQEPVIALLAAGPRDPEHWDGQRRPVDFFDLKGDVEALLSGSGESRFGFEAAAHPALHPGQSARILADGKPAGWIGRLHPRIQHELDLAAAPVVAELILAPLLDRPLPAYHPISRFPSIRRDLALIVDENLTADELIRTASQGAPETLRSAFVFDVYRGKGVDSGRKSFALGLILQDFERTLTDQEIDNVVGGILQRLQADCGATLRE